MDIKMEQLRITAPYIRETKNLNEFKEYTSYKPHL